MGSIDVQRKNEVTACLTCEHSCPITLTSWLCYAARAAHTYDKVGTCAYWPGLIASIFCPCCTLCYMNAFTDLNAKLGGEQRSMGMCGVTDDDGSASGSESLSRN